MTGPNRIALLAALLFAPAIVHAEEKSPEVVACEGKKEGDTCAAMKLVKPEGGGELERQPLPGVCSPDECCELDYSKGSPPQSVCGPCLVCKPGAPAADGGDAAEDGASVEPPRASAGDPPAQSGNDKRGCSIGHPVSAASLVLLALAFVRRRKL